MRTSTIAAVLAAFAARAVAQAGSEIQDEQADFFGKSLWLWAFVPMIVLLLVAWRLRKPKRTIRSFNPVDFETDVLKNPKPVLVHFYRDWSIGDQVMIAQVERIAQNAKDDFEVGWVDAERFPALMGLYSNMNAPAILLFAGGKRILQCEGVHDEADIRRDVLDAIERWRERTPAAHA